MESIVDPAADSIWGAVEIVATLEGKVEKQPRTDDEWRALRRHAVTLMEAGNLLVMPGRTIARPGEKAGDPRVDLHPDEIEARIARRPVRMDLSRARITGGRNRDAPGDRREERQGAGRRRRGARSGVRDLPQDLLVSAVPATLADPRPPSTAPFTVT